MTKEYFNKITNKINNNKQEIIKFIKKYLDLKNDDNDDDEK